jgi:hypothetical protein
MRWRASTDRRRRFNRPIGCLIWLVALVVLIIVLSALFGGFQKGTKANGVSGSGASTVSSSKYCVNGAGTVTTFLEWACHADYATPVAPTDSADSGAEFA